MDHVKIISFFIMIVLLLVGCLSDDNDNRKNSEEIKIELTDNIFHNDDFLLNKRYQVNLNFSNNAIDVINLSLDDFILVTRIKTYIADKTPNLPHDINKSESKKFTIEFDTEENEEYENFRKIVYESKEYGLYYELQIPK
jgi:hypothetical protein